MSDSVSVREVSDSRAEIQKRRLKELAEAALQVLSRYGYERTQMADVAKAMGVAVGTVYLYVESKEALFDLALRYAACDEETPWAPIEIPVKTPAPGSTVETLRLSFAERAEWPVLSAALAGDTVPDAAGELAAVLQEQYHLTLRYRRVLLLLIRSALEFPGLSEVFVTGLRDRLVQMLAAYLEKRAATGLLRSVPDFAATAAVMVQAIAWANLQRSQDPGLATLSDAMVEAATLDLLVQGMKPVP